MKILFLFFLIILVILLVVVSINFMRAPTRATVDNDRMEETINPNYTMATKLAAYSDSIDYLSYNSPLWSDPINVQSSVYQLPVLQYQGQYYSNYINPATSQDLYIHYQSQYGNWEINPSPAFEDLFDIIDQLGEEAGGVNVGLSKETILNHLNTCPTIRVASQNMEEEEVCALCLSEYQSDETIGILQCGHCYHADCIKEWLLHKNLCPLCKATALNVH